MRKVKAAKDLEDANPLCLLFGTTLGDLRVRHPDLAN